MSKKDLRAYFEWFLAIIPERIKELTSAVKSTLGFEDWEPDFSPASLNLLGEWFASQVETRPRTPEEIDGFNAQSPYPISPTGLSRWRWMSACT
jgi:hypothetical protein